MVIINTYFWTFFYMIGFVATMQIVNDFGPNFTAKWLHHRFSAPVLTAAYVMAVMMILRSLETSAEIHSWVGNAMRTGTVMYTAKAMEDQRAFRWLIVAIYASSWLLWNRPLVMVGLAVMFSCLVAINHYKATFSKVSSKLVLIGMSLLFWTFNGWVDDYSVIDIVINAGCFIVVILLAHGYSRMLALSKARSAMLLYGTQHDDLTGVGSLSKFTSDFARIRQMATDGAMPSVHLVMIDIDYFKRINDTYGHLTGNHVLEIFASDLQTFLSQAPFPSELYRTGGEEFSIIVTGAASTAQVAQFMERYRQSLINLQIATGSERIQITISVGIDRVTTEDTQDNQVLARADALLYAAKHAGRNVVRATQE